MIPREHPHAVGTGAGGGEPGPLLVLQTLTCPVAPRAGDRRGDGHCPLGGGLAGLCGWQGWGDKQGSPGVTMHSEVSWEGASRLTSGGLKIAGKQGVRGTQSQGTREAVSSGAAPGTGPRTPVPVGSQEVRTPWSYHCRQTPRPSHVGRGAVCKQASRKAAK